MREFTPRPYQALIIEHILTHPRCAVWAGMGMGKTVSTLMAIRDILDLEGGRALILAPLRVAQSTWPDEVEKWEELSGMRCAFIGGSAKKREAALASGAEVMTINYENLPWLVERLGDEWPFTVVVADEATRLKSFRTHSGGTRAKALGKVMRSGRIDRFIELTGTPAPNGLLDLWGQMWFLDGGKRLGKSMNMYRDRYFRPLRVGVAAFAVKWIPYEWTQAKVMELVDDLTIKVNPEEWLDITEPIVTDVEVKLDPEKMKLYRRFERDMFVELGDVEVEAPSAAVLTNKCLQLAGGNIYADDMPDGDEPVEQLANGRPFKRFHAEKVEALRRIVSEANGTPVLVSYQFKHEAHVILSEFKDARLLDKNPETIREWNAGRIPILLAHPASCGHGLNLQDGGNILVFYSTGWNLEEHDQMVERIGPTRQKQAGYERPVWVYNLITKGTLDESVQKRITTKREVLDLLLERRKDHD